MSCRKKSERLLSSDSFHFSSRMNFSSSDRKNFISLFLVRSAICVSFHFSEKLYVSGWLLMPPPALKGGQGASPVLSFSDRLSRRGKLTENGWMWEHIQCLVRKCKSVMRICVSDGYLLFRYGSSKKKKPQSCSKRCCGMQQFR